MLELLQNFLADILDWISSWFNKLVDGVTKGIIAAIPDEAVEFWNEQLDFGWVDSLGLLQVWEIVTFLIPVYAILPVIILTFQVVLAVRVIRWLIGFVPTVEG